MSANQPPTLASIEEISRQHHIKCYGVEKYKIEWQTIDHIGVWLYCGNDEKPQSSWNIQVALMVPKPHSEKNPCWCCYMGPIPEFEV